MRFKKGDLVRNRRFVDSVGLVEDSRPISLNSDLGWNRVLWIVHPDQRLENKSDYLTDYNLERIITDEVQ